MVPFGSLDICKPTRKPKLLTFKLVGRPGKVWLRKLPQPLAIKPKQEIAVMVRNSHKGCVAKFLIGWYWLVKNCWNCLKKTEKVFQQTWHKERIIKKITGYLNANTSPKAKQVLKSCPIIKFLFFYLRLTNIASIILK